MENTLEEGRLGPNRPDKRYLICSVLVIIGDNFFFFLKKHKDLASLKGQYVLKFLKPIT